MFNVRLTDDHLFRKWLFTGLSVVISLMVSSFMLSFTVSFFFIMVSMATNTNKQEAKNIWLIQYFSRNISLYILSKYLKKLGSKCRF